ncbi:MAG TPA: hypothetical protein VHB54_21835 [Mucilaginibacter sp.]|nr:hypothetical protein [Mucilaginibacter sp.]
MRTLFNPWFIAGCSIWLITTVARDLGHPIPIANSYVNDAFAVPVIANIGLWFQRVFLIKSDYYIQSPGQVIFIVVYVSLLFEVILPLISKRYTADWVDVLLYIAGGFFFYWVMNKPLLSHKLKALSPKSENKDI